MSKGFWAGVMVVSLVVTGASALFLQAKLKEKATIEVKLNTVVPPRPKPVLQPIAKTEPAPVGPAPVGPVQKSPAVRNILFTLYSSSAREVYILGDFNKWFREPLDKKGAKTWTTSMKLEPGTYEYMYVINGKKVRDPNNSRVSKSGKSLLTVKPLQTTN